MNKKELSQLYYLNKEIEQQKRRIEELECVATSSTAKLSGVPYTGGISDKVGKYAAELADLKALLELNIQKCWYELNRLNRFIDDVDDSELRMILRLRYINGLQWEQVAANISSYATGDSVRMMHSRFLQKI